MPVANRLFLPQAAVDTWLESGAVRLVDDRLTFYPQKLTLRLESALRFHAEVTGGDDPHDLVGKVKPIHAVAALDGEHFADSVVLGDNAYTVEEGFLAETHGSVDFEDDGMELDPITRLIMEL